MADLRQSLNALVEHPPARPAPMDVVAARGVRFARRRRAARSASGLLMVAVVATAGLVVAQQEPRDDVTADQAGAPVVYTDNAGDAIGPAPESAAYDIVRVAWALAAGADDPRPRDYTISITVAGEAGEEWWYAASADLQSGTADEMCQIHHFLTPGGTAFANVFCGLTAEGTRRLAGRVEGGPVTSTPTSGGGTELVATFDASTLPLEATGQVFVDLWAFTSAGDPDNPGPHLWLDDARTALTYRP